MEKEPAVAEAVVRACALLKAFRQGFAAQAADSEFSREVAASVERAAAREQIPLVTVDNRYSPTRALRNADLLVRERVDLVFEFQAFEQVAPIISSKFIEADILGGRALGRWAKSNWNGEADEILQVELPLAGPLPQLRITGMLAGLAE